MFSYLNFENAFRGSREQVLEEQKHYLPLFSGLSPILDAGSGRGEFLELLKAEGIASYGVEVNEEMLDLCRGLELPVVREEITEHLEKVPEGSLGGIFASHLVEHLEPPSLLKFINLSFRALRSGGVLLVETLNPASLFSYSAYFMDSTHRFPVHPNSLKFYMEQSGFTDFDFVYREYFPADFLKLDQVPCGAQPLSYIEELCCANFRKLQMILDVAFAHFIYGLGARKP